MTFARKCPDWQAERTNCPLQVLQKLPPWETIQVRASLQTTSQNKTDRKAKCKKRSHNCF